MHWIWLVQTLLISVFLLLSSRFNFQNTLLWFLLLHRLLKIIICLILFYRDIFCFLSVCTERFKVIVGLWRLIVFDCFYWVGFNHQDLLAFKFLTLSFFEILNRLFLTVFLEILQEICGEFKYIRCAWLRRNQFLIFRIFIFLMLWV